MMIWPRASGAAEDHLTIASATEQPKRDAERRDIASDCSCARVTALDHLARGIRNENGTVELIASSTTMAAYHQRYWR